jgi:hypothetical protein
MKAREIYPLLGDMYYAINRFTKELGHDADNLEIDWDNPHERMIVSEMRSMLDKLGDVLWSIKYLNRPLTGVQERLSLRHDGRYGIENGETYWTSGSTIEYLDEISNEWVISTMEHNGKDYYIVYMGRASSPNGVLVRTREHSY